MNTGSEIDTERCFVCGDDNTNALQTHHIVPKRHGGADDSENLVDLCANCHQAVERLYNKRFYRKLGIADRDRAPGKILEEINEISRDRILDVKDSHRRDFGEFPEVDEEGNLPDEKVNQLGVGEWKGYHFGYYDAMVTILDCIAEDELEIPNTE